MDSVIKDCRFEAHECTRDDAYAVRLIGTDAPLGMGCGHCGEVVYPEFRVISGHTFSCDPHGIATWYSSDLEAVVHRCNQPTALVDVEQFLDLAVPA